MSAVYCLRIKPGPKSNRKHATQQDCLSDTEVNNYNNNSYKYSRTNNNNNTNKTYNQQQINNNNNNNPVQTDAQAIALLLQKQLDEIDNEIRLIKEE